MAIRRNLEAGCRCIDRSHQRHLFAIEHLTRYDWRETGGSGLAAKLPPIWERPIGAAAKYMPLGQMALSPQCGFWSTVHGYAIHVEAQAQKLRLIVETARKVWGSV